MSEDAKDFTDIYTTLSESGCAQDPIWSFSSPISTSFLAVLYAKAVLGGGIFV